jgi:hypothetical protein
MLGNNKWGTKIFVNGQLSICKQSVIIFLSYAIFCFWSRGSSVSVVSDYGLDDRAIGVHSPAGAKDFSSSLCVQTGSGAHPASCTVGTGGTSPGGKARPGRDADHSPPSSAEVENEYELYLLSLQAPPGRVAGLRLLYYSAFHTGLRNSRPNSL